MRIAETTELAGRLAKHGIGRLVAVTERRTHQPDETPQLLAPLAGVVHGPDHIVTVVVEIAPRPPQLDVGDATYLVRNRSIGREGVIHDPSLPAGPGSETRRQPTW